MWTPAQQSVIDKTSGNTVVFAAPGSGKTTVLTHHIVHQLDHNAVRANGVLLITFTRHAATQLHDRVVRICATNSKHVGLMRIGTFHAECFRMLLQAGVPVRPILGQREQMRFIRQAVRESGYSNSSVRTQFEQMLTLSRSQVPHAVLPRRYRPVARRYNELKKRANAWDFDDIIERFCGLSAAMMARIPPIEYVLVDEFQDTNSAQWFILNQIITCFRCRVFVVGDDDQSIYGFRGASPEWLLQAADRLPDTAIHYLSTNFRSDADIVRRSSALIEHNQFRTDKSMVSHHHLPGSVRCIDFKDEVVEAQKIAEFIEQCAPTHGPMTIAVLARTRRQLYNVMAKVRDPRNRNAVTWSTFHGAKGREWDIVVIIGAVEQNPYLMNLASESEEERRLFYVAMTRARHALRITVPHGLLGAPVRPSRFIEEAQVERADQLHAHSGFRTDPIN